METIRMGGLVLEFLQDKIATSGGADIFRMNVQPDAKVPAPHYHESWDETVYGLNGTLSFRLDGRDVTVGPGDSLFIARGVPHGFRNDSGEAASCLCVLTPGVLGPDYFREIAALLAAGGPPDPSAVREIMSRHGLVPADA
jgi:quercetin dioxygenase-like cupin family protein